MIFAIFNNNYSRLLILDFLENSTDKDVTLINIGKTGHILSEYCSMIKKGLLYQACAARRLSKRINSLVKQGQIITIIIPNDNNLVSGAMSALAKKNYPYVNIVQVAEGTLNYRKRELRRIEWAKTIPKKMISILFFFPYILKISDHMDMDFHEYEFICRNPRGLNSAASKITIIENKYHPVVPVDPFLMLIVGQHIMDGCESDVILSIGGLIEAYIGPRIDMKIVYLPHPRSVNFQREVQLYYDDLAVDIDLSGLTAEGYILKYRPGHVVALGGSSLFIDLARVDPEINLYAVFCKRLEVLGFKEYGELAHLHESLGVTLYD